MVPSVAITTSNVNKRGFHLADNDTRDRDGGIAVTLTLVATISG